MSAQVVSWPNSVSQVHFGGSIVCYYHLFQSRELGQRDATGGAAEHSSFNSL